MVISKPHDEFKLNCLTLVTNKVELLATQISKYFFYEKREF